MPKTMKYEVSVNAAPASEVCRSLATCGSAGRYMSIANGPTAESRPRSRAMRNRGARIGKPVMCQIWGVWAQNRAKGRSPPPTLTAIPQGRAQPRAAARPGLDKCSACPESGFPSHAAAGRMKGDFPRILNAEHADEDLSPDFHGAGRRTAGTARRGHPVLVKIAASEGMA